MTKWLIPERAYEDYSRAVGYTWTIESPGETDIEIWPDDHRILIRQEEPGDFQVDIISLNRGQVYDLLKVLSRALEV